MGKIKKIDDDWLEYTKENTKIKFSSDDNLPLNKPLKFYQMAVTIRCVISEDNKLFSSIFRWSFVQLIKMLKYDKIDITDDADLNKTNK